MDASENDTHQHEAGGDVEQPITTVKSPHAAVNNPTGSHDSNHKEKNWPQRIEAVCAVCLVIITAFYTYYAAGQLHKLKRATEASEKAATAAASAANTASDTLAELKKGGADTHELALAAKTQAENSQTLLTLSQMQFRSEQRPLLWATPRGVYQVPDNKWLIFMEQPDGTFHMGVAVEIKNSGKSPAVQIFATKTEYKIGPPDKVREEVRHFIPDYVPDASGAVAPGGGIVPVSPNETLTKEQVQAYNEGSIEIYVVGGVKYTDIFPTPIRPYETTYCWRVNPAGLAFGECSFKKPSFSASIR